MNTADLTNRLFGDNPRTANIIEVYHEVQKIMHPKLLKHKGEKSILPEHVPEAAQAYRSATARNIIQQAGYIDPILKEFIEN